MGLGDFKACAKEISPAFVNGGDQALLFTTIICRIFYEKEVHIYIQSKQQH